MGLTHHSVVSTKSCEADDTITPEAHSQIRIGGVEGSVAGSVVTHLPQKAATGTGAIIDVNGIKTTSWVILNAVIRAKEEQRFEFKATDNTATAVSGASWICRACAYFTSRSSSCTIRLPGLMYHVQSVFSG